MARVRANARSTVHHHVDITIVRFVRDDNPGWVECTLTDAHGRVFTFVEKVPVVSDELLAEDSLYPRAGVLGCTILARRTVPDGRELVTVDSQQPWGIEASTGESRFEVEAGRIREG